LGAEEDAQEGEGVKYGWESYKVGLASWAVEKEGKWSAKDPD
jgi:hypothetical protein